VLVALVAKWLQQSVAKTVADFDCKVIATTRKLLSIVVFLPLRRGIIADCGK
jgi:hypothetical protein